MNGKARGWTLETRIRVGLVLTAALLAPVVGLGIWGFSEVAARIRQSSRVEAMQLRAETEASRAVAQAQLARARFTRTRDPLYATVAEGRLEKAIGQCRDALGVSDRERAAFARAARLLRAARDGIREEAPIEVRPVVADVAVEDHLGVLLPAEPGIAVAGVGYVDELLEEAEQILEGIGDRAWTALDRTTGEVDRLSQRWLRNLITASLVTLLGVVAAAFVLPSRIAQPFRALRALVRRVEREGRVDPGELARFPDDQTRKVADAIASSVARSRETIGLQAERIRTLEQRYRVLLRQHPRPALVVAPDQRIVLAGGPVETVLGLAAPALEGCSLEEFFSADGLPAVLRRIASEEESRAVALVNARKADGGSTKVQATVTALRDDQRRVREYLVLLGPDVLKPVV